jgi:phosphatidate phosphatase APP1
MRFKGLSDALKLRLGRIIGADDPIMISPYLGYGTPDQLSLSGRVLEDERLTPLEEIDTTLENLLNMFKRFEPDPVPGARLLARFQSAEQETLADQKGKFHFEIKPSQPLADTPWHEVELELLQPVSKTGQPIRATGRVLVPPSSARFAIISDIDDTIVWTNVVNKLQMILIVLLRNERTRIPFKGVAGFYQALQQGAGGSDNNPIFYVSSSPWNLYNLLLEFLVIHQIPLGPILLRNYGGRSLFSARDHSSYKLAQIEPLLALYPHLPFILIGDSGQQDPEIYLEVVKKYPNRIRVIYIRNVNPDPARIDAIDALIEEVRQLECQLVLVPDSEFAAAHAAAEGLIRPEALSLVRSHKKADKNAPSTHEMLNEQA